MKKKIIRLTESDVEGLVKKIIKESDFDWVDDVNIPTQNLPEDEKYLALLNVVDRDEMFGNYDDMDDSNFQELDYDHYGITQYELDNGETWAVGDEAEFDNALLSYFTNLVGELGPEIVTNPEDYIYMSDTDRRLWAGDESDNYVSNFDDDELIDMSSYAETMTELQEELEGLEEEIYDREMEKDDLEIDLGGEEDVEEMERIEEEIGALEDQIRISKQRKMKVESELDTIVDDAREEVREANYDEWYDCLSDPYHCLVTTHGYYNGVKDLIEHGGVIFDEKALIEELESTSGYGEISSYDGDYHGPFDGYYVMRVG